MAFLSRHSQINRNSILLPVWLRFFIIVVLVLGIFFRFVNLERKVYWFDEVATLSKISGYTNEEEIFNGHISIISIEDLHKYQRLNPKINVIDTIKKLSLYDPKHTPLYFVIVRFWVKWFGTSIAVIRSLSAFISLLVFPCLYWLCLELFESSLVGWVAVALIAVSPFHVLYAQEARMYSLHTVMILLSTAALLRAMRVKTKLSWGFYSATLSLGLYTQTLFGLVTIGQAISVVATERFRLSKVLTAYLIASFVGVLTFIPWLYFIVTGLNRVSSSMEWSVKAIPLSTLVRYWGINLSRLFLDLIPTYRLDTDFSSFNNPLLILLMTFILIMSLYSSYFICRNTAKRTWLFILPLISITALTLALPDLIAGGIRSNNGRYLIASYLGIHLTVAYLLATQISSISAKVGQQRLWQMAMIILISCGVVSCAVSSQADTWWNKYYDSDLPPIAKFVNQVSHPLLLVDSSWASQSHVWSISYLLKPQVRLNLLPQGKMPKIPDGFSDIFLFNPSEELKDRLTKDKRFKIKLIYKEELSLWKL